MGRAVRRGAGGCRRAGTIVDGLVWDLRARSAESAYLGLSELRARRTRGPNPKKHTSPQEQKTKKKKKKNILGMKTYSTKMSARS